MPSLHLLTNLLDRAKFLEKDGQVLLCIKYNFSVLTLLGDHGFVHTPMISSPESLAGPDGLLFGLQLLLLRQPEEISKLLGILYHRLPSIKEAVDAYIDGVNRFLDR